MPKLRGVFFACVFFIAAFAVSFQCVYAQSGKENWPTTLEEAVSRVFAVLSAEDKKFLRQMRKEELTRYHITWGMGIRNEFGLWNGNEALLRSACGGELCHPDSASMRIMEGVWDKVQNEK